MEEEGCHDPKQADEWIYQRQHGSPLGTHSAAYPASSNNIQNYRQDAGFAEAHSRKGQECHEDESQPLRILQAEERFRPTNTDISRSLSWNRGSNM